MSLFGTDGVRGVAGEELTAELALSLGRAAAQCAEGARPQILIVRDTRESGPMLESAFAAGVAAGGGDAWLAGVLPTPAASVLVRVHGMDMAAVISASHNPWRDNGIKLFGADGRKPDDELQARVEELVAKDAPAPAGEIGRARTLENASSDYLRELERTFALDLGGRRIALDCGNGAAYRVAPAIFSRLGAAVDVVCDQPDGRNINEGCGATHPESLARHVRGSDAEIGFAFDGDADRLIAIDADGEIHDGDELISLAAVALERNGRLGGGVAVSVMSNFGFHAAMEEAGIEVATTPVGDRHIGVELHRRGWTLGGEQSGHVIWTDAGPTGDGIAAALLTLLCLGDRSLAQAIPMRKLPQTLVNVRVTDRDALASSPAIAQAVEAESGSLEGRGRVLLRPSGTEPLVRVMVEAPTAEECQAVGTRLAEIVQRELGSQPA
jgi:phosphoglucosamine mutase